MLAHSSYLINVGWMNERCPHVTEQTSYLSKSLIPLKRSWVPFCRHFEFSFHPHKSCKPFLGLQWANLLPLTAQSQPLDTLRWSLITSKGSVAVFLISVASFLSFCSPWCSNPNIPVVSQCTTALMWYDHIHDMQMLFYILSCFLFFACFIMGISLWSWFRWQAQKPHHTVFPGDFFDPLDITI